MPIQHDPKPGDILQCDYGVNANPQEPEMGKKRPVIVLATKSADLCIVVPISTKEPQTIRPFHREMDTTSFPVKYRTQCWAKCDMISHAAHFRLDRLYDQDQYGKRKYGQYRVSVKDWEALKECMKHLFNFD